MSSLLEGAQWIWADAPEKNAYVAFVKEFDGGDLTGSLQIFADTYYKIYINGLFVNAGPAPFRKPVIMVDEYDIGEYLNKGKNTICVLCHFVGKTIKWNKMDAPCLGAAIQVGGQSIVTDTSWDAYPIGAWAEETPDITWALGGIELFDCNHPDVEVLRHFASEDYGNTDQALTIEPQSVNIVEQNITDVRPRMVPNLYWQKISCRAEPQIMRTSREIFNLNDHASRSLFEHRLPIWDADAVHMFQDDGVHLNRWIGERGFGLQYDFRRIVAGEFIMEVESDSHATMSIGFTERVMDNMPEISRSGSKFYMRVTLRPGINKFRMYKFNGFRYLYVTCKDFEGDLHIKPPRCYECYGDLPYKDSFFSNDRFANALYDISRRSIVLNTQAQSYDCNSREQGCYWGDSLFILDIAGHMSGDFSHLKHLCYAMKDEYQAVGEIGSSLFGLGTVLFDYSLVPMEVMRRYYHYTGDIETIKHVIDTAETIVNDFRVLKEDNGLIALSNWTESDNATIRDGLLFLDHAGLGWHPRDSVGIDRDDFNAGIQLFYIQALRALDELHQALGVERCFEQEIQDMRSLVYQTFYDKERGLLIDAVHEGKTERHYSQIVNALAISTEVLVEDEADVALSLICDVEHQTWVAHGTPYGYFFVIDALKKCNRVDNILPLLKHLFTPMLDRGATCTWETFGGEVHDSFNHAWSANLSYALQKLILGLDMQGNAYATPSLEPQIDLFDHCHASVCVPQGCLQVQWQRVNAHHVHLEINADFEGDIIIKLGDQEHVFKQQFSIDLEKAFAK